MRTRLRAKRIRLEGGTKSVAYRRGSPPTANLVYAWASRRLLTSSSHRPDCLSRPKLHSMPRQSSSFPIFSGKPWEAGRRRHGTVVSSRQTPVDVCSHVDTAPLSQPTHPPLYNTYGFVRPSRVLERPPSVRSTRSNVSRILLIFGSRIKYMF